MRRVAVVLALFLLLAFTAVADVTVTFIDVGRGDAIWIHDDTGYDVLIDGGSRNEGDTVLSHLADVPDLDVVMWTHGHADHIGGLIDVLADKPVGYVLYNGFDYNSITFNDLLDVIIGFGIPMTSTHAGNTHTWGESSVTVLHPDWQYANTNDNSVVVKLSHGDVDFLLTGDAEWGAESTMLGGAGDLSAEILKLGHHGSNTSTYSSFLDVVSPDSASSRWAREIAMVIRRLLC